MALTLTSVWKRWFYLQETSEWDCVYELSPPILYSSLELGFKKCTTGIKDMHWLDSMSNKLGITSTTVIQGVCYHCLVFKADQGGCFTLWSSGKLYLYKLGIYKNKLKITTKFACFFLPTLLLFLLHIHSTLIYIYFPSVLY